MDTPQIYYYRNDTLLEVVVSDQANGEFINNATVEATVKDAAGQEVVGQSWPLTLSYIADTDGVYRGILDSALSVAVGDKISVEIAIDAGSGRDAFMEVPVTVRQRGKVYF